MTNVAHHEPENQLVLAELARIIRPGGRLIVIETVPEDKTEEALEITFLNDYFYNRILHCADIAVPGTYETLEGWIGRFDDVGFELDLLEDVDDPLLRESNPFPLGYDQPTIRDLHALYVFRRK